MIVESSGTGSKYIIVLEFVPEVINCAIVLVLIVIFVLVPRFFIVAAIQGTPTPVKRAAAKGTMSKAKKSTKPDSLPGDKGFFKK